MDDCEPSWVYLRIDISSPLHAVIVGALDLPDLTRAITIQGDRAFVTVGDQSLDIPG
jgi:hypothetical protein